MYIYLFVYSFTKYIFFSQFPITAVHLTLTLGTPSWWLARPTNARPVMEKVSHAFVIFFVCLGNALAMRWYPLGIPKVKLDGDSVILGVGSYQWVIWCSLKSCQDNNSKLLGQVDSGLPMISKYLDLRKHAWQVRGQPNHKKLRLLAL